jgi:leucine dehydrogenase
MLFDHPLYDEHEDVVFCRDGDAGLRAIVAIHRRGPRHALGGTRMHAYASEADALGDALRLSRAMSFKSAMAGLPYGGGKAVVIGDPQTDKTPTLLLAMAEHIERLGGLFATGEDVGIGVEDVEVMRGRTRHLVGARGEDSSLPAALGVYHGIRAAVAHRLGRADLDGVAVAVQGVGHVGRELCRLLARNGVALTVADVRPDAAAQVTDELGARVVDADAVETQDVDVLAPCALGGTLTSELVGRLRVRIVAGAANNQLVSPAVGRELAAAGVLYAPDYVVNAGGVINNAMYLEAYDRARVMAETECIYDTLRELFAYADAHAIATSDAADQLATARLGIALPAPPRLAAPAPSAAEARS